MSVTIRSEVRFWKNASRIDDCTQNYLTVPKSIISESYKPEAGSVVSGRVVAVSMEPEEGVMGGDELSSVVRDLKLATRIILGTGEYDYLFIFEKDWKKLARMFTVPGRRFATYKAETITLGKKKERIYHGDIVYWEEDREELS